MYPSLPNILVPAFRHVFHLDWTWIHTKYITYLFLHLYIYLLCQWQQNIRKTDSEREGKAFVRLSAARVVGRLNDSTNHRQRPTLRPCHVTIMTTWSPCARDVIARQRSVIQDTCVNIAVDRQHVTASLARNEVIFRHLMPYIWNSDAECPGKKLPVVALLYVCTENVKNLTV